MGVSLTTVPGGGVGVVSVQAGGPAAKAGIEAGSRITAVAGHRVLSVAELAAVLAERKPGQRISVDLVTPSGSSKSVELTLGEFPGS
jgi:S1-C subfamily serine protease